MKLFQKIMVRIKQKLSKISRKQITVICLFSLLFSIIATSYSALSNSHINSMTVTLNYEGAKKGLTPDGKRFNIAEIKSDEVLKRAIEILGDDKLTVSEVKSRIHIDSKMPRSAIDQTTEAIASGSTYSYSPSEFDIYYSQKNKFIKNQTVDFLNALSEAYNEYFLNAYSDKSTILEFDESDDFSQYDYEEIHQVLADKVNSMITHLGSHQEESNTFRSQNTGYSFENLMNMLINLRDINLTKLEAYIIQNRISKDRTGFVRKQQYRVEKASMQFNMSQQASDIANNALDIYNAHITGVAFIPSVDQHDQFYMSRTKTGLDNLVNQSYSEGIKATSFKKNIDQQNDLINKFTYAADTPQEAMAAADGMISEICEYIERISTLSIQTDNDYISYKTNDYITFRLPDRSQANLLIPLLKNFIIGLILTVAAIQLFHLSRPWLMRKKKKLEEKLSIDNEG